MHALPPPPTVCAGLVPRGLAYLVDCALAFGVFAVTQLLLFSPLREALGIGQAWFHSGVHTELYTLLTISLPIWLYFALFDRSPWQGTPGKRLLRLRVARASSGERIRFPRSLLRTAGKLLPWEVVHLANNLPEPIWYLPEPEFRAGFAVAGLLMGGYVAMVGVQARKQGPHDVLAGTVVVKGRGEALEMENGT